MGGLKSRYDHIEASLLQLSDILIAVNSDGKKKPQSVPRRWDMDTKSSLSSDSVVDESSKADLINKLSRKGYKGTGAVTKTVNNRQRR